MNQSGLLRVASVQLSKRVCDVCQKSFIKQRIDQKVCGYKCAAKVPKIALAKRIHENKPLQHFVDKAETAFNKYIVARDAHLPCISCGRTDATIWNAGHYVAVGACRTIRFHEDNVNKQCARPCNKDLGGNAIKYRQGLVLKIGAARVEFLEGWHEPIKMTKEIAMSIEAEYKAKLKAIQS